ncbi:MAG: hypothetical protein OIF40_07975 [Mangrovicoccus sp.]|nr:hypothetical protein [Mangrovicoccus sp.]
MSDLSHTPGGGAIGWLSDLPPTESRAIIALRLWSDTAEGQAEIRAAFERDFGPERGAALLENFEMMVGLCDRYSRRPFVRLQIGCRTMGADECWFARLVALAGQGAREDALLVAMALVRPDIAPSLTALAERVGMILPQAAAPITTPRSLRP